MKKIYLFLFVSAFLALFGCSKIKPCRNIKNSDSTVISYNLSLSDFLIKSGNYITQKRFPPVMEATILAKNLNNSLVIDIRDTTLFRNGHIPGSLNISTDTLFSYLVNKKDIYSFKNIVIVDESGPQAVYIATLLNYSGFENSFGLKFGIGAWNRQFSGNISKFLSNKFSSKIDTIPVKIPAAGNLPLIKSENIFNTLNQRVEMLIKLPVDSIIVSPDKVFSNPEDYFIIAYWDSKTYNEGHIKGSYNYNIRSDLSPDKLLNTLPTDKKILIYCNTGHHAIALTAYLRLLGYDAVSMMYGVNSFMNVEFAKTNPGGAILDANNLCFDFPIVKN